MRLLFIIFSTLTTFLLFSCSSDSDSGVEDDTLSHLMRERLEELRELKSAIENNSPHELPVPVSFMDGVPSRDELTTEAFQAQLLAFEMLYDTFRSISAEERKERYNLVVQSCIACHQNYCPGPIRAIRTLEFEPGPEPGFILFE